MSKQTPEMPVHTQIPRVSEPLNDTHFGFGVVTANHEAIEHSFEADYLARQADYVNQLQEAKKYSPPANRAARAVLRLTGKLYTPEEQAALESFNPHDNEHNRVDQQLNAEYSARLVHERLNDLRSSLYRLTPKQQKQLGDYMRTAPPIIQLQRDASVGEHEEPPTWVYWMGNDSSDEQLLNILEWHNHTLATQERSAETQEAIDLNKKEYKAELAKGVQEGWLDPHALEAAEEVDDVHVYIGDVFDTIMQYRGGYHILGSDNVVIAQGTGSEAQERQRELNVNIDHALKHEFNHAVLGMMTTDGMTRHRWIDEAVTEHIAEVMKTGDIKTVDPNKRPVEGAYVEERELLDIILNYGDNKIPIETVTRAYSSEPGLSDARGVLFKALKESWGDGSILAAIDLRLELLEEKLIKHGYQKEQAQDEAIRIVRSDLLQQPNVLWQPLDLAGQSH